MRIFSQFELVIAAPYVGTGGNDRRFGTGMPDVMDGLAGHDDLNGKSGNDTLVGGLGNNSLTGGPGRDLLDGGANDDSLYSGPDDDTVIGGNGKDTIDGGEGDDVLEGGNGEDRFIFANQPGSDRIEDFDGALDQIDISIFGFANLQAVKNAAVNDGSDVRIALDGDSELILSGHHKSDLDAGWFVF